MSPGTRLAQLVDQLVHDQTVVILERRGHAHPVDARDLDDEGDDQRGVDGSGQSVCTPTTVSRPILTHKLSRPGASAGGAPASVGRNGAQAAPPSWRVQREVSRRIRSLQGSEYHAGGRATFRRSQPRRLQASALYRADPHIFGIDDEGLGDRCTVDAVASRRRGRCGSLSVRMSLSS